MINFDFSTSCYSCTACQSVCPKNAILMSGNGLPTVTERCVNCGLCEKVCPYLNERKYEPKINGIGYICKTRDEAVRLQSSSGGVFYPLAKAAIEKGWSVCGCVYDSEFMPKHILSNKVSDIVRMRGSKYVKSDMSGIIPAIRETLAQNRKVLFSGTPCQIAGVRNCFPKDAEIIYIGVVCHGSIERDIWEAYLKEESKRGKIVAVTMRDKTKGWMNYGLKFTFQDGLEHITYRKNDGFFLKAFTDGLLERKRCLKCNYKGSQIQADILLGDAWGMDSVFPEMADSFGMSSVVCISEKGEALFQEIVHGLEYKPIVVEEILKRNLRTISPAPGNKHLLQFRKEFERAPESIIALCEKYKKPTWKKKVLSRIRRGLRCCAKSIHVR